MPTFIECAREATGKYQDQNAAIMDGYRRLGRDFPAMGEHWIRVGLVFDGKFDPAHPEVLNYVVVDGRPRLIGVGYAVALLPGESSPDRPAGQDAWHDHFRTIEEETVLPEHHSSSHTDAARIAMMHAWIWLANPAGTFAPDNWAIPYLRLGIVPPENGSAAAARALALMSGASDYFATSFEAAAGLIDAERPIVAASIERARAAVETLVSKRSGSILSSSELDELSNVWSNMWTAIDAAVSADARRRLQHLSIR